MCRVSAVEDQKGCYVPVAHVKRGPKRKRRRVGKTTTCVNLGIGLARAGKKVLLVEADAQGRMAVSLGVVESDKLDVTLVNIMEKGAKPKREIEETGGGTRSEMPLVK